MWINYAIAILSTLLGCVFQPIAVVTVNVLGCWVGCAIQLAAPLIILSAVVFGLSFIWPGIRDASLVGLVLGLFSLLLVFSLDLVWVPFYGALLGLSYLYRVAPWLSLPIGIIGIPLALIGNVYVSLMPAMGRFELKWVRESICCSFPYSADFNEYYWFAKQNSVWPEGMKVFSLDDIDLDEALAEGAITQDQFARWSRVRNLYGIRNLPGPPLGDLM